MWMEKDGIRVNVLNVSDQARFKTLGYQEVKAAKVAAAVKPEPAPEPEKTPEKANADAVAEVNASAPGSKTRKSKPKAD